jgi:RNA polymerase sporulation-specific sigma factor
MLFENNTKDIMEAQNGNKEIMSKLIEENNGLIWSIVKRFKDRGYELEDLYQIGTIGFIKCIKRFDTSFDVKLSTYAVPYILGEIKRFIRDDGAVKVSRGIKELATKIRDIQARNMMEKGEEITITEIAKELKISKEEVAVALDSLTPVASIYDEAYSDDEGGMSFENKISNNIDEAELITNKICIQELIKDLDNREKQIIMLRYYKNNTQMQVSRILGISQVQVSRIEKKILETMKKKIS